MFANWKWKEVEVAVAVAVAAAAAVVAVAIAVAKPLNPKPYVLICASKDPHAKASAFNEVVCQN